MVEEEWIVDSDTEDKVEVGKWGVEDEMKGVSLMKGDTKAIQRGQEW